MRQKLIAYRDLKPVIRKQFVDYLRKKETDQKLTLPKEYEGKYSFEALSDPQNEKEMHFSLLIPAERPEDAIVILEADVSRIDGSVLNWRCNDDAFISSE